MENDYLMHIEVLCETMRSCGNSGNGHTLHIRNVAELHT